MKTLQWNMEEVFYFPSEVGVPSENGTVKVKAGFTENRTDDAVRLTGIYHIAANVDFAEGQRQDVLPEETVYVDDVELDGQSGYFEYAVPLYVDLPPEVTQPLKVEATDVQTATDENGAFKVSWCVTCSYDDAVAEAEIEEEAMEDKATAQHSAEATQTEAFDQKHQASQEVAVYDSSSLTTKDDVLSYIATLPDEWTSTTFRSNDVFVQQES